LPSLGNCLRHSSRDKAWSSGGGMVNCSLSAHTVPQDWLLSSLCQCLQLQKILFPDLDWGWGSSVPRTLFIRSHRGKMA
jgi:hypothetical protein